MKAYDNGTAPANQVAQRHALEVLGMIERRRGNPEAAIAHTEAALALARQSGPAHHVRAAL